MQTPTTTTRENSGAPSMIAVDHAGHADALEDHRALRARRRASRPRARRATTAPAAAAASPSCRPRARARAGSVRQVAAARRPRRTGESCCGSTTTSAPQAVASARRPGEKSLATTVRTPLALSMQDHGRGRPARSRSRSRRRRLPTSPRRTACQATAIGSVSAATSGGSPFGTGSISDSSTSTCSA